MKIGRSRRLKRPPIADINKMAEKLAAQGRDLINLGQAVFEYPPPAVLTEANRRFHRGIGVHAYSPDPGTLDARQAVARFLRKQKGIGATADEVMLTCGANQAFANVVFAVTEPGDEVVFFGPHYFDHLYTIQLAGCVPVEVPLRRSAEGFGFAVETLQEKLTDRARAVVMISPNNPTGAMASPREVEAICELCRARDLWLISDEVYDLLTFGDAVHVSPGSLAREGDGIAVIGSFSKIFAYASGRIGYIWAPAELAPELIKVQDALVVCAPVASQVGVTAILAELEDYLVPARQELARRRVALLDGLERSSLLRAWPPAGGTFALCRIETGEDSLSLAARILEEAGVVTVPGTAFGTLGVGTLRLSFGNQCVERIELACERLMGC